MTHALASARLFAHKHDELPAFHAAYLVITVLSAALLSLGAFAALIAGHMALDYVKYRDVHRFSLRRTIEGIIRESLFDITMLMVGITFSVYLHHTMAIASISGILRSEMTVLRALGTVIPKFAILNDSLKVLVHVRIYLHHPLPRVGKAWTFTERLALLTISTGFLALLSAGPLLGKSQTHVLGIITDEMVHWVR